MAAIQIGRLSSKVSDDEVVKICSSVGLCKFRRLPSLGYMDGIAFVSYAGLEEATRAQRILNGRIIGPGKVEAKLLEKVPVGMEMDDTSVGTNRSERTREVKENGIISLGKVKVAHDGKERAKRMKDSLPQDISSHLGFPYEFPPQLEYRYPLPTQEIIQNIAHALVAVHPFYVQVCHLMNKMNLPPPFGMETSSPKGIRVRARDGLEKDEEPKALQQVELREIKRVKLSSSGDKPAAEHGSFDETLLECDPQDLPPRFQNHSFGEKTTKILMKGLPPGKDETELLALVETALAQSGMKASEVRDVRVMTKGRLKGHAFVSLSSFSASETVLNMFHARKWGNHVISCQFGRVVESDVEGK